jgi:two-component system LytT family response regulator
VFLDIQMPAMNGFELLESLPELNFHVVFVTAFDEYAVRAFDFNAIDYIMKPVRKTKLIQAVEKVENELDTALKPGDIKALINNLQFQKDDSIQTIAIPTASGYEMIHMDEVSYLHAQNNYTFIYRVGGEKYLVSQTIKKLEDLLPQSHFYRAHKSYIVNLKQAVRFIRSDGGYLVLKDDTEIPVSRNKKEGLMRLLNV